MNEMPTETTTHLQPFDPPLLTAFVARQRGQQLPVQELSLDVQLLRGGLEAAVARVRAYHVGQATPAHVMTFVVKRLEGDQRREAAIYETVLPQAGTTVTPRLLEVESIGPGACYLYLEWVPPWRIWPWADTALTGLVLDQLTALHAARPTPVAVGTLARWDYEADLLQSAQTTLDVFEQTDRQEYFTDMPWAYPALRRIVASLAVLRGHSGRLNPPMS